MEYLLQIHHQTLLNIILSENKIHNVLIGHGLCCGCLWFTGRKFIKLYITQPPLYTVLHIQCWGRQWLLLRWCRVYCMVFKTCFLKAVLDDGGGGFSP